MISELKDWYEGAAYNRQTELFFRDCDKNKNLRLSALLSMFVDNAGKDYTGKGYSHDNMLEREQAFLLSRIHIKIEKMPYVDTVVSIRTCERSVKGALFLRDFSMKDSNGNTLACATSDWLLVNTSTRRILRPADFWGTTTQNEKLIDCEDCTKLTDKDVALEFLGNRKIMPSDLDGNGHLYSAKYADIALDFLNPDIVVKEFSINYKKEVRLGQTLSIYAHRQENKTLLVGKLDDIDSFICEITE